MSLKYICGSRQSINLDPTIVTNESDVLTLMEKSRKKMSNTKLRFHLILTFTVSIEDKWLVGKKTLEGMLTFYDLASEKTGDKGFDARLINQSIIYLSRVINALIRKEKFIPYTGNKLTESLKDSFDGSAKTVQILATLRTDNGNNNNCLHTLKYLQDAKIISTIFVFYINFDRKKNNISDKFLFTLVITDKKQQEEKQEKKKLNYSPSVIKRSVHNICPFKVNITVKINKLAILASSKFVPQALFNYSTIQLFSYWKFIYFSLRTSFNYSTIQL
jgi:hypothetical protein